MYFKTDRQLNKIDIRGDMVMEVYDGWTITDVMCDDVPSEQIDKLTVTLVKVKKQDAVEVVRCKDCTGCRFVGTYDTEFPCANCSRKTKDYYTKTEPQKWTKENCKGCKYNEYPYDSGTCFVRVCINGNKYEPQTERSE